MVEAPRALYSLRFFSFYILWFDRLLQNTFDTLQFSIFIFKMTMWTGNREMLAVNAHVKHCLQDT